MNSNGRCFDELHRRIAEKISFAETLHNRASLALHLDLMTELFAKLCKRRFRELFHVAMRHIYR